ncbi:ribonuclease H [Hyphomonas hirschiana VP5]|nr:ribonuclease H [Hyphomonas hirschiana VP5]
MSSEGRLTRAPKPRTPLIMTDKDMIEIWTDGACSGNPGPGGWGALIRWNGHEKELYGGDPATTNNRMEMTAVIEALNALNRPSKITLNVDSTYVKDGLTKWIKGWKRNGWKTADKKPVKNQELWMAMEEACKRHEITWVWVKGHAGDEGNERADGLARKGTDEVRGRK